MANQVRISDGVYNNARDESISCNGCDCAFWKCSMHMQMNEIIRIVTMYKKSNKDYQILHDESGYPFLYRVFELKARKKDSKSEFSLDCNEKPVPTFDCVVKTLNETRNNCVKKSVQQKVI